MRKMSPLTGVETVRISRRAAMRRFIGKWPESLETAIQYRMAQISPQARRIRPFRKGNLELRGALFAGRAAVF